MIRDCATCHKSLDENHQVTYEQRGVTAAGIPVVVDARFCSPVCCCTWLLRGVKLRMESSLGHTLEEIVEQAR